MIALGISIPAFAQTGTPSQAMPQEWDSRIPLPPGAVLVKSTVPKNGGVVCSADFLVKGDYKELVDFYETQLPKAGFDMGPKVAVPARKVYNRSFIRNNLLDSVVVVPDEHDPSKFSIRIAWTPQSAAKPAAPKTP